jgi:hypothetical protein
MDYRLISCVVAGSEPHNSATLLPRNIFRVPRYTLEPSFVHFMSNQLALRSLSSLDEYVNDLRERLGMCTIFDYEILLDRDILQSFASTAEVNRYRACHAEYINLIVGATAGRLCSVPVLPLIRFVASAFIDLTEYDNRDYLFLMMRTGTEALLGKGVHHPVQDVESYLVTRFSTSYYQSLTGSQPMTWAERVIAALQATLSGALMPREWSQELRAMAIAEFTKGFSSALVDRQDDSLFEAQVRQGLGLALKQLSCLPA